jgi:GNAT superfamily N-acetyltransferase
MNASAAGPSRDGHTVRHAVQVDLVTPSQHESLVDLLCELHAYYNEHATVPRDLVRNYLVDTLLGADSPLQLAVAFDNDTVLGFAAISLTWSLVDPTPDKRRHCWLKELYVRTSARSQGVGHALMAWVARHAVEQGCARIDWPVQAANTRGQAFYEGLGATQLVERLSYRLSEPNLSRLAGINTKAPR